MGRAWSSHPGRVLSILQGSGYPAGRWGSQCSHKLISFPSSWQVQTTWTKKHVAKGGWGPDNQARSLRSALITVLLGGQPTAECCWDRPPPSDGWQQFLTSSFSSTPHTLSLVLLHLPAYFHVWLTLLDGCSVISTMPVPAAEVIVILSASTF